MKSKLANRRRERVDAANALVHWFMSQQMDHAVAADVITLVLAMIINATALGSRKRSKQGIRAHIRDLKFLLKRMREKP